MKVIAIVCAFGALLTACSDDAASPDANDATDATVAPDAADATDDTDATGATDATPETIDTTPVGVAGRVALPGGVTAASVVNALGSTEVDAGGFTLPSSAEGRQLAIALSAAGKPLLMGWLDPDHDELSTRTTAEVVAYLAIGGYHVPVELQVRVIEALTQAPELDAVASALDAALVAHPDGPFGADDADPALAAALEAAVYGILASETPRSLLVNPSAAQSGVRLDTVTGVNEVVITNTYRRRGFAFVDRVATYQGQVATPAPAEITRVEIDPVEGLRDVLGTIKQIIIGANEPRELSQSDELAYTPKSSAPIELKNVEGVSKTRYRIAIVGPGEGAGDSASLSAIETEEQRHTSMRFVVEDYVIPFITGIIAPVGVATNSAAGKAATQSVIDLLSDYPEVVDNAVTGAVANVVGQVIGYSTFAAKVPTAVLTKAIKLVAEAMYGAGAATAAQAEVVTLVKGVIQTMAALNVTLKLTDSGIVDGQMALSNRADVWTVDVSDVKIVLDPADSTIAPGEFVTLTTHVPDAGDDVDFEYRFETPGEFGTLQSALARGNAVTSSDPYITYDAAEPGTETVTVTVFEIRGSDRVELGHADATVRVTGSGIVITPRGKHVAPYGTLVLSAGLPAAQPGETRRLVWAVDGTGVTLGGQATVEVEVAADAEPPTVTFQGGFSPGEHTVTAKVYAPGSSDPLATGSTTVTVDNFRAKIAPAAANLEPGASRALDATVTPAPRDATITYKWAVASDEGTIDGLTAVAHDKPAATDRVTYQSVAEPQHCQQKVSLDVTITSGGETLEVPRTHAFLRIGCPVTASIAATPNTFEVPMDTQMILDISLSEGAPPPEELRYVYLLSVRYPAGLPLDGLTDPDGTPITGIPTESPRVIWTAPSVAGSVNLDVEVHHVVDGEDAIIATVWAVLSSFRPDLEEPGTAVWLDYLAPASCATLDPYGFTPAPMWAYACADRPERKFLHVIANMPPYTTAGWCHPINDDCYPPVEHDGSEQWKRGPPYQESEPFIAQSFAPPEPGTHWVYVAYLLSGCYAPEVVQSYKEWVAATPVRCIASDQLAKPE